jgi:hypothetical protein
MCAADAGADRPEKVSFTDKKSPTTVTMMNPVAADATGGTSFDPARLAVKIPSALAPEAAASDASSSVPNQIFLFTFLPSVRNLDGQGASAARQFTLT